MIPGGPGPFGWPEEPDGPGDEEHGAVGTPGGVGLPSGWVPPSERTWRHPSELGRPGANAPAGAGGALAESRGRAGTDLGTTSRPRTVHRVASMGAVMAAVAAVAVGSFLLTSTGEGPGTPDAAIQAAVAGPVTALASCCHLTVAAAHRAERGLVAIATPDGQLLGCGVVVAGAGLVATTADAVAGRRSVRAVTAGGRRVEATVLAVDRASDVALVSVRAALPIARFAADDDVGPSFPATAMALTGVGARHRPATLWSSVTVTSVGTAVPQGDAAGMAAIMVRGGQRPGVAGQALIDATGDVLGLLDRSGGGHGTWPYLPSSLVVGVADELATTGKVAHGWLDAQLVPASPTTASPVPTALASDATVGGAEVTAVQPGGAATRALRPGDIIVAVDGQPVRSAAELRSQLYVLPPGDRATVTALRGGREVTEVVELAPSP